jgi:hypothetical protein
MKLLIIATVFAVLFFLYWLTSKDRSLKGMVGSILADFESSEPNPLAPKEGFHGGRYGLGGGRGRGWWRPSYHTDYIEYVPPYSYAIGI